MYVHMYVYIYEYVSSKMGNIPNTWGQFDQLGLNLSQFSTIMGFNYRRTGRNKLEDKSHLDLDPNQLGSSKNNWWFHSQHCQNPGFSVRKFAFTQLAWTCTSPKKSWPSLAWSQPHSAKNKPGSKLHLTRLQSKSLIVSTSIQVLVVSRKRSEYQDRQPGGILVAFINKNGYGSKPSTLSL